MLFRIYGSKKSRSDQEYPPSQIREAAGLVAPFLDFLLVLKMALARFSLTPVMGGIAVDMSQVLGLMITS